MAMAFEKTCGVWLAEIRPNAINGLHVGRTINIELIWANPDNRAIFAMEISNEDNTVL